MKNQIKLTALIFAAIFFIFSCEKDKNLTPRSSINQSLLINKWWHRDDSLQHIFFNSNGKYTYIKGQNLSYPGHQYSWNWGLNDTLEMDTAVLASMPTSGNKALIIKLTTDTLIIKTNYNSQNEMILTNW